AVPNSDFNPIARRGNFMIMPMSNLVESNSMDGGTFEEFYAGPAPWDIDKPQVPFVAAADRITGPILDAGCGTGEHALFFASRASVSPASTLYQRRSAAPGAR